MIALTVRPWVGRDYQGQSGPCPVPAPSCKVPYHFLVGLLMFQWRNILVGALWSSLLSLKMEEEAESAEARSGQSFGNNRHIPLGKGPTSNWTGFFFGVFLDPDKVHPIEAEQLACSEQP